MTRDQALRQYSKNRDLSKVNLFGVDLSGVDLSGADLYRADLSVADLSGVDLSGADLSEANLYVANLSEADLSEANFSEADLSGADLSEANLYRANFSGADLSGADFYVANLRRANLRRANLFKTRFPAPTVVLLAEWGRCSDQLTVELMRYDAANHPDSSLFDNWVVTDSCPYVGCRVQRSANFRERKELWSPGPAKSALELMDMLLAEHCVFEQG